MCNKIEAFDNDMDKRFEAASIYRSLLNKKLTKGNGEVESLVEKQIKDFIEYQLKLLLGIVKEKTESASSVFSEKEVTILKFLCNKMSGSTEVKPSVAEQVEAITIVEEKPKLVKIEEKKEGKKKKNQDVPGRVKMPHPSEMLEVTGRLADACYASSMKQLDTTNYNTIAGEEDLQAR